MGKSTSSKAIAAIVFACIALMAMEPSLFAAEDGARLRIINVSSLVRDGVAADGDLAAWARMPLSDSSLFPDVAHFDIGCASTATYYVPDISFPSGAVSFSGGITIRERLEFISLEGGQNGEKIDAAIVSKDGAIRTIDKEIVIDYRERTIKTYSPIAVQNGDTILLFVRDRKAIHFGDPQPYFVLGCG